MQDKQKFLSVRVNEHKNRPKLKFGLYLKYNSRVFATLNSVFIHNVIYSGLQINIYYKK